MSRENYARIALEIVPRMLSSLDRDPHSDTYGCLDKAYWYYKQTDFPCARYQEPALMFALLYANKFQNNPHYRDEKLLPHTIAALNFLARHQNSNGSFDEWYPNEHSYVGTAFPMYNAAEAFKTLRPHIKNKDALIQMFKKAGSWLTKNRENVSNQEAGAVAALHNISLITREQRFKKHAQRKLAALAKTQSKEGWFPEYGGPDFGYLTVLLDFLGKYYKQSKDPVALKLAKPALAFLTHFIHPDGSLGGVHGSRNTEFKLPHGLEIFAHKDPNALWIADQLHQNIHKTLNPTMMDDRFAFQYSTPYLQAHLEPKTRKKPKTPTFPETKTFPDSGLLIHRPSYYYLALNMKKGGVFRLFKNRTLHDDSGFIAQTNSKTLAMQWNNSSTYKIHANEIRITGSFRELYPTKKLTPLKNILLRTYASTLGRKTSTLMKDLMRKKTITTAKPTKLTYERTITLESTAISLKDRFKKPKSLKLTLLTPTQKFNPSYTPTAAFHTPEQPTQEPKAKNYAKEFATEVTIERRT